MRIARSSSSSVDRVIVIGASAGGIAALQTVLAGLPANLPAAVVLVVHRTPGRPGMLCRIFERGSSLRFKDAQDGEALTNGTVYIAPADLHMLVTMDHRVRFTDGRKINFTRASADPLFRSAAAAFGDRATAVVLSGLGRNGAKGALAIRQAGGVVIAQDAATSQHFGMPSAAIQAGAATDILPIFDIAPRLNAIAAADGANRDSRSNV